MNTRELHAHHRLIHALVAEIRNLREQLRDVESTCDWQAQRAQARDNQLNAQAARAVQQAREAEERTGYEAYERQQALRALERAYRLDDEYAEKKALAKLRRLS